MNRDPSVPDRPGVVAHPPLIYAAFLLAGVGLEWAAPLDLLGGRAGIAIGVAIAVAGFALALWAVLTFGRAGTNVPTSLPATTLVRHGPYRWSRNPIYFGLTTLYAGLAVALDAAWALILLPVLLIVMHHGVIAREERYLEGKFGATYREYRRDVRRWF